MNKTLHFATGLINKNFTHILEFGVNSGGTVNQLRNSFGNEFELFGFDSFEFGIDPKRNCECCGV